MFGQIDGMGSSPDTGSDFERSGEECKAGIPPEVLKPADKPGIEAAIKHIEEITGNLLRDTQAAAKSEADTLCPKTK